MMSTCHNRQTLCSFSHRRFQTLALSPAAQAAEPMHLKAAAKFSKLEKKSWKECQLTKFLPSPKHFKKHCQKLIYVFLIV